MNQKQYEKHHNKPQTTNNHKRSRSKQLGHSSSGVSFLHSRKEPHFSEKLVNLANSKPQRWQGKKHLCTGQSGSSKVHQVKVQNFMGQSPKKSPSMQNISGKTKPSVMSPRIGGRGQFSPYKKNSKININMEIKNLNIYGGHLQERNNTNYHGSPIGGVSALYQQKPRKKLHKKTISCLPQQNYPLVSNAKHTEKLSTNNLLTPPYSTLSKHSKTKSQQNIRTTAFEALYNDPSRPVFEIGQKQDLIKSIVSKYAFCNRVGTCIGKTNKQNQDSYIIIENFLNRGKSLFGVCDGHGVNGHYVSEFIKQILPQNLEYFFLKNRVAGIGQVYQKKQSKRKQKSNHKIQERSQKPTVQRSLKETFSKTAKNLAESGIDIMFSGSTACLIYLDSSTLYCANLGDSRAVLFSRSQSSQSTQPWKYKPLSFDHKAQTQQQAYRIKMNGGRVFPYRDAQGQQLGPYRVWVKEQNIPGLAMTRSFGDYVASTVGVISEPQVISYEVTKDDKFMVVASDGLWEFINQNDVMSLVLPAFLRNDAQEAVKVLERAALEAWKREDQNIDDITIVVVFFKYY